MNESANILVVDDLPENLTVLGYMLKKAGHRVRATLSGELALNAAAIEPPEIVLLDIMMPGMDGFEVCRRLKADPRTADIPVLFVSALNDPADKVKSFETGCVDFVSKPFDEREVLARVTTHVALYRMRRELAERNLSLEKALADLAQAQGQLVSAAKMASLGTLTAGIAHELNNPINFISANAQSCLKLLPQLESVYDAYDGLDEANCVEKLEEIQALKEKIDYLDSRSGFRELLNGICVGAERVTNIVRGLRLFARNGSTQFTEFDLHENIKTALLMLGSKIGKRIRVEKDFAAMPVFFGQSGRINQVLVNLLSNAVDAINEKPEPGAEDRIIIRTAESEHEGRPAVSIEVTDTGVGMDEEAQAHFLEPFYTTKAVGAGMGLGLSIAYGIIKDHGGILEAEGLPEGGARFRIILPRQK